MYEDTIPHKTHGYLSGAGKTGAAGLLKPSAVRIDAVKGRKGKATPAAPQNKQAYQAAICQNPGDSSCE